MVKVGFEVRVAGASCVVVGVGVMVGVDAVVVVGIVVLAFCFGRDNGGVVGNGLPERGD